MPLMPGICTSVMRHVVRQSLGAQKLFGGREIENVMAKRPQQRSDRKTHGIIVIDKRDYGH
jgi:hypothetical protein